MARKVIVLPFLRAPVLAELRAHANPTHLPNEIHMGQSGNSGEAIPLCGNVLFYDFCSIQMWSLTCTWAGNIQLYRALGAIVKC